MAQVAIRQQATSEGARAVVVTRCEYHVKLVADALVGVRLGGVAITQSEAIRLAEKVVERLGCKCKEEIA